MISKIKLKFRLMNDINKAPTNVKKLLSNSARMISNISYHFSEFEYCHFVVAYRKDKPVGIIAFDDKLKTKRPRSELELVYVTTHNRNHGVMRGMFKHLLRYRQLLTWSAVTDAIPAYQNIGSKKTSYCRFSITPERFKEFDKN